MSLRLVEVHRSADGGWELVRGGLKPACAAAAAAATPATGALPAPPPDPGQPPRFRPLAALFAECLKQDSQLNAAFAVAHTDTEPLSPTGAICAPVDISPPAAGGTAGRAGTAPSLPLRPAALQPVSMLSPGATAAAQRVAAAAGAASAPVQAPNGGTETQEDFPLSSQLLRASPPLPPAGQQQLQAQTQNQQAQQQDQQVPATPSSQQQPASPSATKRPGPGGELLPLALQHVAATVGQEVPAVQPSTAALPAGGLQLLGMAPSSPAAAQAGASEAETPLLSTQPSGRQAAAATLLHSQQGAEAGLQPQHLSFAPETAADVLLHPPDQQQRQPAFVPETAADLLPPGHLHAACAPATAADMLPPLHLHATCVPETAVDALQLRQLQFVPDTVAEELPEAVAVIAAQQVGADKLPDLLPPTALDLPTDSTPDGAPPAPGNLLPHAGMTAAVAAGEVLAKGGSGNLSADCEAVEATAVDELAALQAGGLPGCNPQSAAVALAAGQAGVRPTHMLPEGAAQHAACPPAAVAAAAALAAAQRPSLPGMLPAAQIQPAPRPKQQASNFGGLADFDVAIEAPAGPARAAKDAQANGGFDYDLSQPSPSPQSRPPAAAAAAWRQPGPAHLGRPPYPPAQQPGWAGWPQHFQQQAPGYMLPEQQMQRAVPPASYHQHQQGLAPSHQQPPHGPPAAPPFYHQQAQQQWLPPVQQLPPGGMQQQFPPQQQWQHACMQRPAHSAVPQQPPQVPVAAPKALAPMAEGSVAAQQQQQQQQQLELEQPRRRVSLLDRDPGSFKPVRPAGAGSTSSASAIASAAAARPALGGSSAAKPAAAETAEARRARVARLQALLAQDIGYEGDLQAVPAGFGPSRGNLGPSGGSSTAGAFSAPGSSSAGAGEDAEARKARIIAELQRDLAGSGSGGRGTSGGRTGPGSMPGKGGPGGMAGPSGHALNPRPQQYQQQRQPVGPPQQPRRQQQWGGQPQHQQWQGPAQQRQQGQQAQPQWQPAHQGNAMANLAPSVFAAAGTKQVWQPPEQQQEGQAPGQQAEEKAAPQADDGDVMSDVRPGMFVTAGGKQSWRMGGGGDGSRDASRLAALMRDLVGSQEEQPPAEEAHAAQGLQQAQHAQQAQEVQRAEQHAPPLEQAGQQGRHGQPAEQQQAEARACGDAATLAAHASPALEAAQQHLLVHGSLIGDSAEPLSLETAAHLADIEAAALRERRHAKDQQQVQQQVQLLQQAVQPMPVEHQTAADGDQLTPNSGSKRPSEEQQTAAGVAAAAAQQPPAKQARQQQAQQQHNEGSLVLMSGRMQQLAATPEAQLKAAAARLPAGGQTPPTGIEYALDAAAEEAEPSDQQAAAEALSHAAKADVAQEAPAVAAAAAGQAATEPPAGRAAEAATSLFTTGHGKALSLGDPAKLAAAARIFSDGPRCGGGAGGSGSVLGAGSSEHSQAAAAAPPRGAVALPPQFSTGSGGSVNVSAAYLAAAQRQYGGPENCAGNGEDLAGGDSTPLLRKQLLRSRASLGGAASPAPAAAAAAAAASEAAAATADLASSGSPVAVPAAAPCGTTPASAPLLGRAKVAKPSRFGPGVATTGQLKRTGTRKPFTPPTASGSGRKFKAPGKVAGTPGASRLGGVGQAAVAHKPAVQLHDLQGCLLKRLLASWQIAAAATDVRAEGERDAAAQTAVEMEVDGGQRQQEQQQAQELPLDSTACAAYRVPDRAPLAAAGGAGRAEPAGERAAGESGQAQLVADHAALATGQELPVPLLGWEAMRQRLLEAGANPSYASAAWARNHFRWVVWKLARLQLLLSSSTTAGSCAPATQLLTAAVVLDELQIRYEREFNRGHRPLLKAVLQHDEVPSAAMVLLVASVHLPPPSSVGTTPAHLPHQGRTPGGGGGGSSGSDAVGATLELTDGWYWVRASCDERLTQLARRGRICQGTKLRICGAELASPGPGEPLDAAKSAVLSLHNNNAHPAPRSTRLGRQPSRSVFVPLSCVAEGGGTLPQTVVVVQRIFTRLLWASYADGSSTMLTPRQHEARMRGNEDYEARLMGDVAAEVQRQEVERCRQWLSRGKPGGMSHVERLYATATVQSGEGGGGGEDGLLASLNPHDTHDLQRHMEGRRAQLERQQQQLVEQRRAGGGGGLPVRQQDLLVLQVSEVCHASLVDHRPGGRERWQPRVAHISIWGGADAARELVEGAVYKVTHLAPDAKSKRTGGCLELKTTKRSHWEQIAASTDGLPPELLTHFKPRAHLGIGQLGTVSFGASLDYTGLLLGASRCGEEGNWTSFQWLMFVDPTSLQQQQQPQQRRPALPLAPAAQAQRNSGKAEQTGDQALAEAAGVAEPAAAAAGPVPMDTDGEGESAARDAIAALLREAVAAVAAAEGGECAAEPESRQQEEQQQGQLHAGCFEEQGKLLHTHPEVALLPPTEVQCPELPQAEAAAAAQPAAAPQQSAPQPAPWLFAVKVVAKPGQFDWLGPDDAGSIFTIKDVRLKQADAAERIWQATGDERCAVQRHKPVLQPTGRGRLPGLAALATARGGPGVEAATGVAAWVAANADLIAQLRQRVAVLMSR